MPYTRRLRTLAGQSYSDFCIQSGLFCVTIASPPSVQVRVHSVRTFSCLHGGGMKTRFELPWVFLLASCMPAMAQHPAEGAHEQGARPPEARPMNPPRANRGRIPPPLPNARPTRRQSRRSAKMEKSTHRGTSTTIIGRVTTRRTTNAITSTIPLRTGISRILVRTISITSYGSTGITTVFGSPEGFILKSRLGIGLSARTGAGTMGMTS
jgi:hypothetical protein